MGYTATFDLAAGRHVVSGDLTVRNGSAASSGIATCYTDVGEVVVGSPRITEVGPFTASSGLANLSFADSFVVTNPGDTSISFRCYREGGTASISYWFANITVFAAD